MVRNIFTSDDFKTELTSMKRLVEVGVPTPGIRKQIGAGGFLNDFLGAEFNIADINIRFPELSKGMISVPEEDADCFLLIKKQQNKLNGGSWIIEYNLKQ